MSPFIANVESYSFEVNIATSDNSGSVPSIVIVFAPKAIEIGFPGLPARSSNIALNSIRPSS